MEKNYYLIEELTGIIKNRILIDPDNIFNGQELPKILVVKGKRKTYEPAPDERYRVPNGYIIKEMNTGTQDIGQVYTNKLSGD